MPGHISVSDAKAIVERTILRFDDEYVDLARASGRILRHAVVAERDLPPFDRATMDGIACRLGDNRIREICGIAKAGAPPLTLSAENSCVRIMTGAALPAGAETIVPIESVVINGNSAIISDDFSFEAGRFIHRKGSDCRKRSTLLEPGIRLTPPHVAVLAANGVTQVSVAKNPSIALISTGDELVAPDRPVLPWQIRQSNQYVLASLLSRNGFDQASQSTIADDLAQTVSHLKAMLESHDVVILSGGVSMGTYDYVPQALEMAGCSCLFHKVAQRPGKPFWFGHGPRGQSVFALPGNPVSALACASIYTLPALEFGQGLLRPRSRFITLASPLARVREFARFVPGVLDDNTTFGLQVRPLQIATSGDISSLTHADGFICIPAGEGETQARETVSFYGW